MSGGKQLLILPNTRRLSSEQDAELREAGFVVIYMKDPSQARLINAELPPFPPNHMLLAALKAIHAADMSTSYRTLVEQLIKAMVEEATP